jgi:site-specific DNA-methyltransferase (cytosine-N4-specific)
MRIKNTTVKHKSVSGASQKVRKVSRAQKDTTATERAKEVDWDFTQRTKGELLEGVHPYPAKFIREIPSTLIDLFSPARGTIVFDPFCGSGTTLVEAQRRGFLSTGVDLNPIACLMSRVKTMEGAEGLASVAHEIVHSAKRATAKVPAIPNIDHWFDNKVQKALAKLSAGIGKSDPAVRDALRLALSSIVVRVSRQESDTRYAAVEKDVSGEDVFDCFTSAAQKLEDALASRKYPLKHVSVLERDALSLTEADFDKPVGLVVTSPPYPNAYEYWLYHKYRMFWLGFDPIAVKSLEIGARAHFFKKNHHTAELFAVQMEKLLQLLERVTVSGAHICIVVGRSIIHGKTIDNARNIEKIANRMGFVSEFVTQRRIAPTRKAFNLSHANIKTETILVLRRT